MLPARRASRQSQRATRLAPFYSLTLKRSCRVPVYIDDAADVPGWGSFRSIAQVLSTLCVAREAFDSFFFFFLSSFAGHFMPVCLAGSNKAHQRQFCSIPLSRSRETRQYFSSSSPVKSKLSRSKKLARSPD